MDSTLDAAIYLASKHLPVFPLVANSKDIPAIKDFPNRATVDPDAIKELWFDPVLEMHQFYNIGVATTKFNGSLFLVAVDIDTRPNKNGRESEFDLELQGFILPQTYTVETASGGLHYYYWSEVPLANSVSKIAPGIDIRGQGGYVCGPGSIVNGKVYKELLNVPIAKVPDWLVDKAGKARERVIVSAPIDLNLERVKRAAIHYLEKEAPLAIKGNGGDATTFAVAAHLVRDMAVPVDMAVELMLDHWNDRCPPGWSPERLRIKVENASLYGKNAVGEEAPESHFDEVEEEEKKEEVSPLQGVPGYVEAMNRNYALVMNGGKHSILYETIDRKGNYRMDLQSEESFHAYYLNQIDPNLQKPVSRLWMTSPDRRSYRNGFLFDPSANSDSQQKRWEELGFYNLWRGFNATPTEKEPTALAKRAVDMWMEHIYENVAGNVESYYRWIIGFFAQMVQDPCKKPHIALVMRGEKGVGKNEVVDHFRAILGRHYAETAKREEVFGNFNAILENKILLTLTEAFWAGEKVFDSVLKDLITNEFHRIRRMRTEYYEIDNFTRIVILGNARWVVPTSKDERRFAVFDVGKKRQRDHKFFGELDHAMENGGQEYLLRTLLDWDYSNGFSLYQAPNTDALLRQKEENLPWPERWWYESLRAERLLGDKSEHRETWPTEKLILKEDIRLAFKQYLDDNNSRSYLPSETQFGQMLLKFCPGIRRKRDSEGSRRRKRDSEGSRRRCYVFPSLEEAQKAWEKYIGHTIKWNDDEKDDDLSHD